MEDGVHQGAGVIVEEGGKSPEGKNQLCFCSAAEKVSE